MRNTICISIASALIATAAAGEIREGCYHRDYSDAHLAKHPEQVVDWMTMIVERDGQGNSVARMLVAAANQGHARRAGLGNRLFRQWLFCWDENGRATCGVECDGGTFTVTRDTGNSLTFRTDYLVVGETEECGGVLDLAEIPGKPVKYRLDLVSDSTCDGL